MTPEELARLHARCFSTTPPPWSEASFRALLADPAILLVARKTGFALARTTAGEAELLTIAVAPGWQRRGIGAKLLRQLLTGTASRGAEIIFCEVSSGNQAALSLYCAFGFTKCGLRKGYYLDGSGRRSDAILMQKNPCLKTASMAAAYPVRWQKRD